MPMSERQKLLKSILLMSFGRENNFFIFCVYILYTIFIKMSNLIILTFCKSCDF